METRTEELAKQQATDVAVSARHLGQLRESLTGFEQALEQLGGQFATQVSEQGSQGDARIQQIAAQVQQVQSWMETRTEELAKQQESERAATSAQLEKLRESLVGFETVVVRLGKGVAVQMEAVDKMEAQGVLTVTRINELTRFIDQLATRVEQGAVAQ